VEDYQEADESAGATVRPGRRPLLALVALAGLALMGGAGWFFYTRHDPKQPSTGGRTIAGFEFKGTNAQGRPEYLQSETGILFVEVPGGTFTMGSPPSEQDHDEDELPHQVRLKPFLIAQHEVTQDEWQRVMKGNPSENVGAANPVESVSWEDAERFCKSKQLALPTEAQWEYACRATSETPYAGASLDDLGWYLSNSGDKTHPVRTKAPNAWGIYDMHGNVREWCADWYARSYPSDPLSQEPRGPAEGKYRVARGGSFQNNASDCRSATRFGVELGARRRRRLSPGEAARLRIVSARAQHARIVATAGRVPAERDPHVRELLEGLERDPERRLARHLGDDLMQALAAQLELGHRETSLETRDRRAGAERVVLLRHEADAQRGSATRHEREAVGSVQLDDERHAIVADQAFACDLAGQALPGAPARSRRPAPPAPAADHAASAVRPGPGDERSVDDSAASASIGAGGALFAPGASGCVAAGAAASVRGAALDHESGSLRDRFDSQAASAIMSARLGTAIEIRSITDRSCRAPLAARSVRRARCEPRRDPTGPRAARPRGPAPAR
jgi:formylglycine-generating enzyme required for sulfatase activity